jgi:hypothetical protein
MLDLDILSRKISDRTFQDSGEVFGRADYYGVSTLAWEVGYLILRHLALHCVTVADFLCEAQPTDPKARW